ncbi:MAG: 16S rRNA (cytosine(1402)-N(4))-methyltransferase RsmH [Lachnospiraceae bacterium]|nr:16S rRNA (cytosine(1402)-N(4))-methyltransferase RsmH [Lachnospiraceae bacterium]
MNFTHTPVLLNETIAGLKNTNGFINPMGTYVDGTLGGGGHSLEIAKMLDEKGLLIGIDQDEAAITAATERLAGHSGKIKIIRGNYSNTKNILAELNISAIDGMILDLGVSSYQLDDPERGFSYKTDTALDMRMDRRQGLSAREIINDYSEMDLYRVIRDYGEEKFAKNIAKHINRERIIAPIETTGQLNEIIKAAIPAKMRVEGGHPSKRTFQAIRIECNRELAILKDTLDGLVDLLKPGGRLAIITFHSLEDRIVKTVFKKNESPCTCPASFPICICKKISQGKVITRKPVTASPLELENNKRAKSAKLRIFEKNERPDLHSVPGDSTM